MEKIPSLGACDHPFLVGIDHAADLLPPAFKRVASGVPDRPLINGGCPQRSDAACLGQVYS